MSAFNFLSNRQKRLIIYTFLLLNKQVPRAIDVYVGATGGDEYCRVEAVSHKA